MNIKLFKNKRNSLSYASGFTLIETLVSLSIFVVSVLTIVVITGQGVNNVTYAKEKLTATLLADEGIELVRNIRDTYTLGDAPTYGWDSFKSIATTCAVIGCTIDPTKDLTIVTSPVVIPCTSGGCPPMQYTDIFGYFTSNTPVPGHPTNFTRTIIVEPDSVNPDDVIKVSVVVSWKQGISTKQVVVSEYLYNWFTKQ